VIARLTAAGIALVLIAGVLVGVSGSSSGNPRDTAAHESSQSGPNASTAPAIVTREDCTQIRGTDYLSAEERSWYLASCVAP
jgi:hypothetical protein